MSLFPHIIRKSFPVGTELSIYINSVLGFEIDFGAFLGAVINFLIVAFIVFCLVKAINKAQALGEKIVGGGEAAAAEPEPAPVCPFCLEEHKPGAKVCPHCGSKLE